ncbi:lipopolysaccharide biosynthesis protein [Glacieibacterium sp.]|uniref:lipopolysaccharide biosynthesis protein n=1 Tax=Glacieibacterium sp. TaxID=2860237 RepID=UPI003B00F60A
MPPAASLSLPPSGLRRVLGNLAHLLGGKAAAGVISLVYLVIVTHTLGARDYGVLILVNSYVVLVGSVVAFSGFHGVVRYGALALTAGDTPDLARTVRFMAVVEFALGAVAVAVAALLVPLVGPRLGWTPDAMRLAIPYSLAVVATVRATPQGLLQVARRFDLIGLHQTLSPLVRLVGAVGVWVAGGGLTGFIIVWLAAAIVEGIAMWGLALVAWRRLLPDERLLGPWRGVPGRKPGFGRFILITNFDLTLRELAPNLAPLTIGWLLGPAAAGLFALAQRASSILQQPAVLLSQASYAVLADFAAKREFKALKHTVWRSALLALAAGAVVVAVLAVLGGRFLTLLGGGSFVGGTALLVLVALGRMAALASAPVAAGLTGLGLPQRSMAVALLTNLGLYPLLPLLLWRLGVDGAGWHAALQGLIATAILALLFRRDVRRAKLA